MLQVSLWVAGTLAGGGLGYLAMMSRLAQPTVECTSTSLSLKPCYCFCLVAGVCWLQVTLLIPCAFNPFMFWLCAQVSLWVAGTLAGGGLGYLAMMSSATAMQPLLLMVVMVGAALLVGLLTPTAARVGITLTLMTLSALVLCQVCWLLLGLCGTTTYYVQVAWNGTCGDDSR
jgi:hypothetical protein